MQVGQSRQGRNQERPTQLTIYHSKKVRRTFPVRLYERSLGMLWEHSLVEFLLAYMNVRSER